MAMIGDVDRNVTITFVGRDNASRAMSSIGSSASKTSRMVGVLTKALRAAALAAATALAAAATAAAYALYDATKAAYYDDIAMKKLAFTQRKAQDATKAQTDATADLIDKLELATGIADDEMRPAMAALAGTGMEVKESHDLLAIALDVSVARGKSVQTVSEALAKAYNGQLTGLQRLGVKVTDASGEALTFSEVLEQLRKRFGGAARAAGRTDPLKRLGAAYNQLKEDVGKQLLPMLRRFSTWIVEEAVPWIKSRLVPMIRTAARWLGDKLPEAANKIREWWESGGKQKLAELWDRLKDLWEESKEVVKQVNNIVNSFKTFTSNEGDTSSTIENLTLLISILADQARYTAENLERINDAWSWLMEHGGGGALSGNSDIMDMLLGGAFAKGGFLKRAQGGMTGRWTLVGEHGPELISNRGYVKTASQTMGTNMGGTVNITVNGAIDPVSTARQIERILSKGGRVTGRTGLAPA